MNKDRERARFGKKIKSAVWICKFSDICQIMKEMAQVGISVYGWEAQQLDGYN